MPERKDKRFRVCYGDEGDIHAFETDDRERTKAMERQFREDLTDVASEMQRRV